MNASAESIRVMHPLFQTGQGGSIPTSALSLLVEDVAFEVAQNLNRAWHSRLPRIGTGFIKRQPFPCFAATFEGIIYAVSIWSNPVARNLPQMEWAELRRLAIAQDAPRNTASRMLRIMAMLLKRSRPWLDNLISYQDTDVHTGCIYAAAGWKKTVLTGGDEWDRPGRRRPKAQSSSPKQRWEKSLCNSRS
jgi:hypothetical protein